MENAFDKLLKFRGSRFKMGFVEVSFSHARYVLDLDPLIWFDTASVGHWVPPMPHDLLGQSKFL